LQQQLLGYSPKKTRKLRNDAIPTLHLFDKSQVENTLLLDHFEETMDVSLHVDSVPDAMTNVSTVNTFESINTSTHIDDSTDVINAVVSVDMRDTSTNIENIFKNTSDAIINSSTATNSPNNDKDST